MYSGFVVVLQDKKVEYCSMYFLPSSRLKKYEKAKILGLSR